MISNYSYVNENNIIKPVYGFAIQLNEVSTGNFGIFDYETSKINSTTPIKQIRWFCHKPIGKYISKYYSFSIFSH